MKVAFTAFWADFSVNVFDNIKSAIEPVLSSDFLGGGLSVTTFANYSWLIVAIAEGNVRNIGRVGVAEEWRSGGVGYLLFLGERGR